MRWRLMRIDVVRLAAFLENEGIKKGDAVAVFTTNSPEMVITYLALSKLSAVCGFININLRGPLLVLAMSRSSSKLAFFLLSYLFVHLPPCTLYNLFHPEPPFLFVSILSNFPIFLLFPIKSRDRD